MLPIAFANTVTTQTPFNSSLSTTVIPLMPVRIHRLPLVDGRYYITPEEVDAREVSHPMTQKADMSFVLPVIIFMLRQQIGKAAPRVIQIVKIMESYWSSITNRVIKGVICVRIVINLIMNDKMAEV